jgi:N6-adenosine-specific RNA methylase IME4
VRVTFAPLPEGKFGAIYADPPWHFKVYSIGDSKARHPSQHYNTMTTDEIAALPVSSIAADDSVLFMWFSWPQLEDALRLISAWGFTYKTCAFCWIKADGTQVDMFSESIPVNMTLGYWTRSNSEACLLATRGKPKRIDAGVRQALIEPRREHSRKPDCVYERIERLVAGPYIELFARTTRPRWTSWGNQVGKFAEVA